MLSRKNSKPVTRIYFSSILIIALLISTGCDSSDAVPVEIITDETTLSDSELEKLSPAGNPESMADNQQPVIYFGFDLRASPQEDAAQYLPFLAYLKKATGYDIKLHFTPKNSTTVKELGLGNIQLAAMGAVSFIQAEEKYHAISLVRGLNQLDKAEYQSVFITRPESTIRSIKDIRGKRVAFGSFNSTQGHIIPRIMLNENGIKLDDLESYGYTGSHQNCAESVISKKFDVCGMQDQLAKTLESKALVKIIHQSDYYPSSGIVASSSLPSEICQTIKAALLAFDPVNKHKAGLYHWEYTEMPRGFKSADTNDYAKLKRWLIKLGFLKTEFKPGNLPGTHQ